MLNKCECEDGLTAQQLLDGLAEMLRISPHLADSRVFIDTDSEVPIGCYHFVSGIGLAARSGNVEIGLNCDPESYAPFDWGAWDAAQKQEEVHAH